LISSEAGLDVVAEQRRLAVDIARVHVVREQAQLELGRKLFGLSRRRHRKHQKDDVG
jgi:hypothetical protein